MTEERKTREKKKREKEKKKKSNKKRETKEVREREKREKRTYIRSATPERIKPERSVCSCHVTRRFPCLTGYFPHHSKSFNGENKELDLFHFSLFVRNSLEFFTIFR